MKNKEELDKKYKTYRWAQHICLVLAFVSCIAPMVISSLKVAPAMKNTESKLALGGVAIFIIAVVSLILLRNVVKKYLTNLPCTLAVFIIVVALLLFIVCLKKIIDDAIAVLLVGTVGCFIGVIFETVSLICKMNADDIKESVRRMSDV